MFDTLTDKLGQSLRRVRGQNRLSEANIEQALQEVRTALLEADVHFRVVRSFLAAVKEHYLGAEVPAGLNAGQYFIKVVNDELARTMGGEHQPLTFEPRPPTVVMLVGLQGSGKTSTVGKLARWLQREGRRPYLVPADTYRPAAIDQLTQLAGSLEAECFPATPEMSPVDICKRAVKQARKSGAEVVLIDTAGRLHIDEALMVELERIVQAVKPRETLFVADGMTGQDAVNTAQAFHERLELSGHVLTKMDGDARGGAALSIRSMTGRPIKFMTVGEKLDALEKFHPERIASRILGMGDLVSLIERAQETIDEHQALEMQARLRRNEFTLGDFLDQLRAVRRMGPMKDLMEMMPGMGQMAKNAQLDDSQIVRVEAIISSMTPYERENHQIINMSRRNRIARGSGTRPSDVNRLLKQFAQMRKMMKKMSRMGGGDPDKAMDMARQLMG